MVSIDSEIQSDGLARRAKAAFGRSILPARRKYAGGRLVIRATKTSAIG
jgi:hypothetical protein